MGEVKTQKAGDGLREFAQHILKDRVTGSRVADYMQFLLEERLVEPDANVRLWARCAPNQFSDASSEDIASMLGQMASKLDSECPD